MSELAEQARALLTGQISSWELLRRNCEQLAAAQTREFDFGRFVVRTQFNPARLASVSARVDPHDIRARACFLCRQHRPPEQAELDCGHGFTLLCNPFPILPEHFTIVASTHQPQRILHSFAALLAISRDLSPRYTVFYNGPQCGASAPDHLHFQAGLRGFMPSDGEYDQVKRELKHHGPVRVFNSEAYLRQFLAFESADAGALEQSFAAFYRRYAAIQSHAMEPMMNLHCSYIEDHWRLIAFLRVRHRPDFYFADDHTRLMLSPGSVDVGGVVVVPQAADFARTGREHLTEMFEQVSLPAHLIAELAPFPRTGQT